MTLNELVEAYCAQNILRPASAACYRSAVKAVINYLPGAGAIDINEIDRDMLLRFRLQVLAKRRAITFNTYRNQLLTLFKFAINEGALAVSPISRVSKAPVEGRRKKTMAPNLISEMMSYLARRDGEGDKQAWIWLVIAKTFYYTGMRRRQLVELRWADIDFERAQINLRADSSKTRREWSIPMADELSDNLRQLKRKVFELTGRQPVESNFVFGACLLRPDKRRKGEGISVRSVTLFFNNLGKKLGPDPISPHRFRHTVATTLVNRGQVNLKVVQEFLGHSDIATTCGYLHPDVQAMRNAMEHLPSPLVSQPGGVVLSK